MTVTNNATGAIRTFTTGGSGEYTVPNLQPGNYQVSAASPGFTTIQERVTVAVGAKLGVDLRLNVGRADTIVEVADHAVAIDTTTQTLQSVIDSKQIVELPTLTRNPYDLIGITGNVSETDPGGNGVGYAINGQRSASTNVLLDGVPNNNEFGGSVGQQVPLDSVQEFSVVTSSFTAEYGRASGGVVNVVTKSGTNAFHGTAYEFNRVSALGSNGFDRNANSLAKPVYDRNQFGYSIGGPAIKDKLFFFENTEWIRVRSSSTNIAYIPSAQFIAAADPATQNFFSTLGQRRPGLQVLQSLSKSQLLANGTNICKGAAAAGGCNKLPASLPLFDRVSYNVPSDSGGGSPQNTYELVGRVDYNLNQKTSMYVRYARFNENDFLGTNVNSPYAGFDSGSTNVDNAVAVSVVHTFNPRFVSQTKIDFNRLNNQQPLGAHPPVPTLYYNSSAETFISGTPIALPGYSQFSPGNAIPFGGPQNFIFLTEDMSHTFGRHQLRFGGLYNYLRDNRTFGAYQEAVEGLGATSSLGVPTDNFLSGNLRTFQAAIYPQGKLPGSTLTLPVGPPNFSRSNRYHEWALYAQDTWKLSRKLTLNLGIRYEYYGVQHNKDPKLDSNYYDGPGANIFQQVRAGSIQIAPDSPIGSLWKPSKNNWAPRVGFAYDVFGDGKTSLRGGYGIGYERNFGNVTFNVIQNPPNYAVVSLQAGVDVPSLAITTNNVGPLAGSSGTKVFPKSSLRNVLSDIKQAYAHFYSASLEHEFGGGVLLAAEYSGSAGENLYSISNPNRITTGNLFLNDPCTPGTDPGDAGTCTSRLQNNQVTNINRRGNGGISNYNALNTRFQIRNFERWGVVLGANYTWSHAIDNLSSTFSSGSNAANLGFSDPFNPGLDRGSAEFDIRHRVSLGAVWNIPVFKNQRSLKGQLLGGWELAPIFTARTGSPFTLFDCSNAISVCPHAFFNGFVPRSGNTNVAAPGVPNQFVYYDLRKVNVDSTFVNRTNTSDFGPYPSNYSGRNTFVAAGRWSFDMGVYKNLRLSERFNMQLRGESFNILNHANYITSTGDNDVSSIDFVSGKKQGNRNMQLAVKLIF